VEARCASGESSLAVLATNPVVNLDGILKHDKPAMRASEDGFT
jgi:hypothetical protein